METTIIIIVNIAAGLYLLKAGAIQHEAVSLLITDFEGRFNNLVQHVNSSDFIGGIKALGPVLRPFIFLASILGLFYFPFEDTGITWIPDGIWKVLGLYISLAIAVWVTIEEYQNASNIRDKLKSIFHDLSFIIKDLFTTIGFSLKLSFYLLGIGLVITMLISLFIDSPKVIGIVMVPFTLLVGLVLTRAIIILASHMVGILFSLTTIFCVSVGLALLYVAVKFALILEKVFPKNQLHGVFVVAWAITTIIISISS